MKGAIETADLVTTVSETYARYLDRSLRKIFRIEHAPIRVRLRSSHKKKSE